MKHMPLAQTVAPKIFRFSDIDAFRSSVRNLNVDFTPLARNIAAEQIVLNLPGCDVNYTKSFPRILDAQLDPNCTLIGFTMDEGVPIRFNGTEEDRSAIVIGSGGAVYTQVEQTPRQYASIVFAPEIEDRGWPRSGTAFKIVETSASAHQALRELTLQVTSLPSEFVDPFEFAAISAAITESLLVAVDRALADAVNIAIGRARGRDPAVQGVQGRGGRVVGRHWPRVLQRRSRKAGRCFRAHDARRGQAVSRHESASLPALEAAVARTQAPDRGFTQRQGLRARLRLLAPGRFLQKLSFTIRRNAFGNPRQVKIPAILSRARR